jgi:prepilin-type N-terminal cleavage/methylation domain-containing protein
MFGACDQKSLSNVTPTSRETWGFTLIELLVVIAIIGMLATLAVVSLNNARTKSRDARRVSDIRQIQTGLELYFSDNDFYPATVPSSLGIGDYQVMCDDGDDGWADVVANCSSGTVYMGDVPTDPQNVSQGKEYTYQNPFGDDYSMVFELEDGIGSLGSGFHTATASGVQ